MRKYLLIGLLTLIPQLARADSATNLLPQSNPQTDQSGSNLQPAPQGTLQPASQAAQPSNIDPSKSDQNTQIISNYLVGEADGTAHGASSGTWARLLQLAAIALVAVAFGFFTRAIITSKKPTA